MHSGALRALEFDRVVDAVLRFAQTPVGAVRLGQLTPEADPRVVESALSATAETVSFLSDSDISLQAPADLDIIVAILGVEGRALEPAQLIGLATFMSSIESSCAMIRRARSSFPILRGVADRTASFEREIADIRKKIDPSGEVLDDASAELRTIRDRLRKQRARLRNTLESYLRGKDTSKYLQQQIVTDRNGRYVLVVRAEHRTAIPGIVHGSSGSGASLFLEPLSTVEINNEIVALEQQEAEEVHRILLELSDAFRSRAADVEQTLDSAAALDVLQARGRFSRMIDGVKPVIAADGRLELRAARHPLLIGAVRRHLGESMERAPTGEPQESGAAHGGAAAADGGVSTPGEGPVPVDILVIPPTRVLVITGPNTGGKTVALKTSGLLPLMAQAGLLVPAADGSQIPVFQSVFADIGDEQSIAANLSTFSGHIANVVEMERALALPAVVLLDEAGSGTDPAEGGALAMAIIDHFRLRGAMVIATTHYESLKTYASTTDGVVAAGFGFDPRTFAPTYQLNYGSPGSSLAFEIATRLGLFPSIIQRARAHRSEREAQLAEHLARIERDVQTLDHERRLAARERQHLAESTAKLQAREQELREREETFRRRMDQRIEERLRDARREIDAVVEALKTRTESMAADAERRAARLIPTGETGAARADARAALDAIADRVRKGDGQDGHAPPSMPAGGPPAAVGDRVLVGALGLEGVVQTVHDGAADVDVRGKRLRVRIDELRVVTPAAAVNAQPARVRVNVDLQPRSGALTDLNLIGCSVDEALVRAEKFLDEALVSELRTVRVIHGYGTGQLRRAIAGFLQTHPFVANFAAAPAEQGGGGVTVVELKE